MSVNPFSTLGIDQIGEQLIAIGALGTAAFGIVDALKIIPWLIPSRGFGYISAALQPYDPALTRALGMNEEGSAWHTVLRSHWINGRPKDEQKAIAVSLIQLGLTVDAAEGLAEAGQVDPEVFKGAIAALTNGIDLTPKQLNVLGRFKAVIEARIDAAYEKADQAYRTTARFAAGAIAVLLALSAVLIVNGFGASSAQFWSALLIGLVAVPLAPVARDLASALSTAARALGQRIGG